MKLGTLIATLAITFFANAGVTTALADEKPSALQTALSDTTISGYVSEEEFGSFPSVDSDISMDNSVVYLTAPTVSFSPSPVPEPSSGGLFGAGFLALVVFVRRDIVRFGFFSR